MSLSQGPAALGPWLRRARLAAPMTLEELADRSGVSVRAISDLERGRTRKPYPRTVRLLAAALGLLRCADGDLGPPTWDAPLAGTSRQLQLTAGSARIASAQPSAPEPELAGQEGELGVIPSSGAALAARGSAGTALAEPGPAAGGRIEHPDHVMPRQLPYQDTFVGRASELAGLTGLLGQVGARIPGGPAISVIAGTAGVGKTALAVHWARQVASRFGDGQLYVNLRGFGDTDAPATPAEAIRGFLDALGVAPERMPPSLDAQAGLFRSLLAGKKMLVVLDNARDAEQVRPLLPGSPGCMVVVSSRSDLAGLVAAEGARPLCLGVFTDTEAHELLARRIGAARLAAEPAAAGELIELCARLPLALAIVAARASARPGFALADLAAELRDARGRLDALATGDHATDVRAVFSWSYRCLQAPAARLFRLLGLHPGPDISAAAAASLVALTPGATGRLLRELTRSHLLAQPSRGRYAFHDLLRVYALERAYAEDCELDRRAAIHRILDHYLHTCHDAARLMQPQRGELSLADARPGVIPEPLADHRQALVWLKAEHHVLVAAAAVAAQTRHDACAWQLPWSVATFLDWQGHWHDWAATQRIALAAVIRLGDKAAQATVRRAYAAACIRLADYDEARTQLQECLGLCVQAGDRAGESRVHRDLGNLFEYQDRYADALGQAEQALSLSQAIADRPGKAAALTNAGWYHAKLGDYRQARDCCLQALDLHRELGATYGEAHTLDTLGYINHQLGKLDEAAACYQHGRSLFRELGDRVYEATALVHLGETHHAGGHMNGARETWQEALIILDDLRHPDADRVRGKLNDIDDTSS